MTAVEQAPDEETPNEEGGGGRVAGGCVLAVALAAAGGVAVVHPEAAYFVTGLVAAAGYRKAHGWITARRAAGDEAEESVDIVGVLQDLAADGSHVRLTQLQAAAGLPDTKAVRALLSEAGIPVRTGVRAAGKNGPGVHRDDVPPLPDSDRDTPSEGCSCRSDANTNANNGEPGAPREELSVEAIGQAGALVRVESERRQYSV